MAELTPEERAHLEEMDRRLEAGETWKGLPKEGIEGMVASGRLPAVKVKQYAVNHKGGQPFSRSLPRRKIAEGVRDTLDGQDVFRFKDGGYTNLNGQPIVRNAQERDREIRRSGLVEDD